MKIHHAQLTIKTNSQSTYEITDLVKKELQNSNISSGLLNLFIMHTSASLFISENADPSVQFDLKNYLNKLAPENDPNYRHTYEGPDDMPAHIKSALLPSSLGIPIQNNQLKLGTWQGIFLWEHRTFPHTRKIQLTILGL